VAYRQGVRLVFLFGFAKNEADNITRAEHVAFGKLGDVHLAYDDSTVDRMLRETLMIEVAQSAGY
jgi:hypothetical protein